VSRAYSFLAARIDSLLLTHSPMSLSVLRTQRLRGGGKEWIECRKCGGERRKFKPCGEPCMFGKGSTKAEEDKALRVFMEERAKRRAAIAARMLAAQQRRHREQRAKKRSDAQELAQAKAKKPKLMREIEQ
jgi:hypothetical protein